jgi:protein-tyrosine phosphatase
MGVTHMLLVMLDFHSHLMPGVDDGAVDLDESRAGIKAMLEAGITGIITTPHISASVVDRGVLDRDLEKIEVGWQALQHLVATEFPKLKLARGCEVMVDVPSPRLDNPLLRLAGTSFVLFEFPFMSIPPNSSYAIREMRDAGLIPILAHPERYSNMDANMALIEHWRDAGAYMQINAGSLVGQYGGRAKKIAWTLLENGFADYLCSDYHARGKCSSGAAISQIKRKRMEEQADALIRNGKKVVRGERPAAVPPFLVDQQPAWKRVFPWS